MFTALSIGNIILYEMINWKKSKGSILPYFFPLLFLFFYLFDKVTNIYLIQSSSLTQFLSSLSYATSGIYIATFCYRYSKLELILKNLYIVEIVITIAIVIAIPSIISSGIVVFGTGTYQTLSYLSAFAFGINLYDILSKNNKVKFKYQSNHWYKSLSMGMLLIQIIGVFLSGGRGGAVLLIITMFVLFYIFSRNNLKRVITFSLLFVPIFYVATSFINPELFDMIMQRSERTFSYVSDDGSLDLSETSGRDVIYSEALRKFSEKPFLGYGIYNQYDMLKQELDNPYVHNIILEIALQGGFVLLVLFLYIFFNHLNKLKTYISRFPEYGLILIIYLYAITFLMFSGTYLGNTYFWFSFTYILLFRSNELEVRAA